MVQREAIEISIPGVQAFRWMSDGPYQGFKERYAVARVQHGRARWTTDGKEWSSQTGDLVLKQPGDVHRDLATDGVIIMQVITLAPQLFPRPVRVQRYFETRDERGAVFHRLHDALSRRADRLELDVAIAETIDAMVTAGDVKSHHTLRVKRALDYLAARSADDVSLDELAENTGADKFHLCRAFRQEVGMPPHAYLLRLRVAHAKALLAAGQKPSHVATTVGFYDQSQLTRHFRRIVGTTPSRYARHSGSY